MKGQEKGASLHLDGCRRKQGRGFARARAGLGFLCMTPRSQRRDLVHPSRSSGVRRKLCAKPLRAPSFCLGRLFFPVSGLGVGFERGEKTAGNGGYFLHGLEKYAFVRLRRLVEAADLSYVLKGSGANLLGGYRRVEVEKHLDVPAHGWGPRFLAQAIFDNKMINRYE